MQVKDSRGLRCFYILDPTSPPQKAAIHLFMIAAMRCVIFRMLRDQSPRAYYTLTDERHSSLQCWCHIHTSELSCAKREMKSTEIDRQLSDTSTGLCPAAIKRP